MAARHVSKALAPRHVATIVEPFAHDRLEDNLNPVGALFYAASTAVCTPVVTQEVGLALGAQAGEARLRNVIMRRSSGASAGRGTPFNMVREADSDHQLTFRAVARAYRSRMRSGPRTGFNNAGRTSATARTPLCSAPGPLQDRAGTPPRTAAARGRDFADPKVAPDKGCPVRCRWLTRLASVWAATMNISSVTRRAPLAIAPRPAPGR